MPVTHPVTQILYRRRDEGSLPGARADGCRVGLVVEGGGMRGLHLGGDDVHTYGSRVGSFLFILARTMRSCL